MIRRPALATCPFFLTLIAAAATSCGAGNGSGSPGSDMSNASAGTAPSASGGGGGVLSLGSGGGTNAPLGGGGLANAGAAGALGSASGAFGTSGNSGSGGAIAASGAAGVAGAGSGNGGTTASAGSSGGGGQSASGGTVGSAGQSSAGTGGSNGGGSNGGGSNGGGSNSGGSNGAAGKGGAAGSSNGGAGAGGTSGNPGVTWTNVYVTWYGFDDNSCDVETTHTCDNIAYPKSDGYPTKHNGATEGNGTYDDPVTFAASDAGDGESFGGVTIAPGTIIYYAKVRKYFIMEDSCFECHTEWDAQKALHVDLWMGPSVPPPGQTMFGAPLINCEDDHTNGQAYHGVDTIIVNPPADLPVDQTMLFNGTQCTMKTY